MILKLASSDLNRRCSAGLAIVCLSGVAIAGCGSSGASSPSAAGASTTSARTLEASKSPSQILADAAAAVRKTHGFRMQGTLRSTAKPSQRLRMSITVASRRKFAITMTTGGASISVVVAGNQGYLRANGDYWSSVMGHSPKAAVLAGRWLLVPIRTLNSLTGDLNPAQLASCMTHGHGTLSIAGRATVDHQPAIILRDAGNAPGDQPSTLAIAATGVPYPLKETETGRQRPGGTQPCTSSGPSTDGTVTLSDFGHGGAVRVPADAVTVKSLFPDEIQPAAPNT